MDKRISKSFRVIFSSLYPNFNEEETKNSEKYFNFILANFPDRSEIILLKIVFFIFSFGIRRVFIKDKNIPKFVKNLQSSNLSLLRKLGSGMTALFGLSTARSLDGEGSVYKHLDYPIYKNTTIEKKDVSIPKSIEVAVIGSGSGGGVAANILNEKYEVGLFEKAVMEMVRQTTRHSDITTSMTLTEYNKPEDLKSYFWLEWELVEAPA